MDAKQIRAKREELLLTQEEFAEEIGVTRKTVNRWENDKTTCQKKIARKIRNLNKENCKIYNK